MQQISGTVHNLSTTGPGTTRSTDMEEVCRFCHVPHRGSPVGLLFNKPDTQALFVPYTSPTLDAAVGPPASMSRLCLTCHDGSIALGDLLSEQVTFPPGQEFLSAGSGGIEPMLRDDHPISFTYDATLAAADGELQDPSVLPPDLFLEDGDQLQCSTCHDAHDNSLGFFLRRPWEDGSMCETCHVRDGWPASSHRLATRATPAGNWSGCLGCHQVHFATLDTPLLAGPNEEDGCYACHAPSGPAPDVQSDFMQTYHHPVEQTTGVHVGGEDPQTMTRHVECLDCHNPHAVTSGGDPMGAMAALPGIDRFGFPVDPATEPQQVCYRCHGLAAEPVEAVPRQITGFSIREQVSTSAASAHPIDRDSQGNSPSLFPQWANVQRIGCTDCHGGPENSGQENRPHGSPYEHILRNNYRTDAGSGFTNSDAALCARCHDLNIVRSGNSNFKLHDKHLKEGVLCVNCHSPHGVVGNATNHVHLINFDLRVVQPLQDGRLEYISQGPRRGECNLTCHGEKHDGKHY